MQSFGVELYLGEKTSDDIWRAEKIVLDKKGTHGICRIILPV